MDPIIAALIGAFVGVGGIILKDYLDRRWQLRQEVHTETLPNYRLLHDLGFLLIEDKKKLFDDEATVEQIKATLLSIGEAIYKLEFEAPPHILRLMVDLMRENDKFQAEMMKLVKSGQKITQQELEEKKEGMKSALVKLFYAMRADAKKSNRGLTEADVRYLLFVRLGTPPDLPKLGPSPSPPEKTKE